MPFGTDPLEDIRRKFKHYQCSIIFDVGANIGQTTLHYLKSNQDARIYSIEPILRTYEKLVSNLYVSKNVKTFQIALGSKIEIAYMFVNKKSDMSRIISKKENVFFNSNQIEAVKVNTLTKFCKEENIKHINFLKIDTEGFDLEVIKGGIDLLQEYAIDFIQIEVGMNPFNKIHVPFSSVKIFMEKYNYYVFGIYNQVEEWLDKKPVLRRADVVFISGKMSGYN